MIPLLSCPVRPFSYNIYIPQLPPSVRQYAIAAPSSSSTFQQVVLSYTFYTIRGVFFKPNLLSKGHREGICRPVLKDAHLTEWFTLLLYVLSKDFGGHLLFCSF